MMLKSAFPDVLKVGLRKVFNDAYNDIPQKYTEVYNLETSTKQLEQDSSVTGIGLLVETTENGAITYEDKIQGYDTIYRHKKYAKGLKFSRELVDDDQYSVMGKQTKALARAAARTVEFWAADLFVDSFTTATGGDGEQLCSTVHPRADGGSTQSNASSTGITFTDTNLQTAMLAIRGQLDDKGQKIAVKADTLIIPPALLIKANILINSTMRSGTADNDLNPFKGSLKIIDWDWLTSSTAWWLLDSSVRDLNWFWRDRIEFSEDKLFETESLLMKARMRFSYGHSDWRGVWGSLGDGVAYAS